MKRSWYVSLAWCSYLQYRLRLSVNHCKPLFFINIYLFYTILTDDYIFLYILLFFSNTSTPSRFVASYHTHHHECNLSLATPDCWVNFRRRSSYKEEKLKKGLRLLKCCLRTVMQLRVQPIGMTARSPNRTGMNVQQTAQRLQRR